MKFLLYSLKVEKLNIFLKLYYEALLSVCLRRIYVLLIIHFRKIVLQEEQIYFLQSATISDNPQTEFQQLLFTNL